MESLDHALVDREQHAGEDDGGKRAYAKCGEHVTDRGADQGRALNGTGAREVGI